MSLFALQKNSSGPDLHQAQEALAGNLCRCTGYRPILDAAEQSCRQPCRDQFDAQQAQTIAASRPSPRRPANSTAATSAAWCR
jgi:xanthine dehydrogenase small subunit